MMMMMMMGGEGCASLLFQIGGYVPDTCRLTKSGRRGGGGAWSPTTASLVPTALPRQVNAPDAVAEQEFTCGLSAEEYLQAQAILFGTHDHFN